MMDEKQHSQILMKLQKLELQINRLVSDAESEKEFRKQRNREIEERLRKLEEWKSELHGRIVVSVSIVGLVVTALISLIIAVIT